MLTGDEIIKRIKQSLEFEGGVFTWDDVLDMLTKNELNIFHNDSGAWITQLHQTRLKKWLNVYIVAGELPDVLDIQDQVVEFAKKERCDFIISSCRKGYGKDIIKKYGWKNTTLNIRKDLIYEDIKVDEYIEVNG